MPYLTNLCTQLDKLYNNFALSVDKKGIKRDLQERFNDVEERFNDFQERFNDFEERF